MSPTQTPNNSKPNQTTQQPAASQPTNTPVASQKTNALAIVGLILAFFLPLVGLILGIVALSQIKKRNEGGKGLAIASIVISILNIIVQILVLVMFWGAIFAAQSELKRQGVDINTQDGTINVENKDGDSASIGNAKIPSGFPSSVPVYPGSKVVFGAKSGGDKFTVYLTTTDSKATVEEYYQRELKANGWVNESDSSADLGFASGAQYVKDGQELMVTIAQEKENSGTAINLIVAPVQN